MATKRELDSDVRGVIHPTRMVLRAALALPDPTAALDALASNASDETSAGRALHPR